MSRVTGDPLPMNGTVAVVGGSLAGLRAVQTLRAEGFTGRLHLIGEELHLPYDRPPLSKQVLAGTWPPEQAMLVDRATLDQLRVELHIGHRATSLELEGDRTSSRSALARITTADGSTTEADGVVLATGARPRRLPGVELNGAVQVLRTIDDSRSLRERVLSFGSPCRLVVIGAGFIGSEVASTCLSLGSRVTVVEALPTPLMPALGEQVGAACARLHRDHGVDLRTGVGSDEIRRPPVDRSEPNGTSREAGAAGRVILTDGSSVAADQVLVGIGVRPNTEWLESSGLELDDGVVCDPSLFCADGIVAAGDLARWVWCHDGREQLVRIEHWQLAAEMGTAAARSLLAGRTAAEPFNPVPYFWSDQYGVRIQMLGRPEPTDDVELVDGSFDDDRFVAIYGRKGRLVAAVAISRPRQLMAFRPLLAAGASWEEGLRHLQS